MRNQTIFQVESVSQKALSASVQEIDMIAGTTIDNVSKGSVGVGLACRMICQIQARNYRLQNGHVFVDKMKHQINYMAHNATLLSANEICGFKQLADDLSDLDSTARYQIKRPRIEVCILLLNHLLFSGLLLILDNWTLMCCMPC